MTPTEKMLAASEAWLGLYADIQERRSGKKFTARMRTATSGVIGEKTVSDELNDSNRGCGISGTCGGNDLQRGFPEAPPLRPIERPLSAVPSFGFRPIHPESRRRGEVRREQIK